MVYTHFFLPRIRFKFIIESVQNCFPVMVMSSLRAGTIVSISVDRMQHDKSSSLGTIRDSLPTSCNDNFTGATLDLLAMIIEPTFLEHDSARR